MKERLPHAKVICIEPNQDAFMILQKNLNSNKVQNVSLLNLAIGNHIGLRTFLYVEHIPSISYLELSRPWLSPNLIV